MRNLELDLVRVQTLPVKSENVTRYISTSDAIYILSDKCVHYIKNDKSSVIANNIIDIDWVPIENLLFMGDGESFYCFNSESNTTSQISISDGYLAYKWNPSHDRIAMIDKNGILKIVLLDAYNSNYSTLGEYSLETLEGSTFINVGWGSKETQFRGSEGKQARTNTSDNSNLEAEEGNTCYISWRDDGDMFAVSYVRNGKRLFKTFSCECEFLFESENKSTMCPQLAWKPDGSLVATAVRSNENRSISFFEKNGLHRFDLPLPKGLEVQRIQWNTTGDILMIWNRSADSYRNEISLWTFTNFKWYMKQNITFNKDDPVNDVRWSDNKWLEVITSKHFIRYCWKRVVHSINNDASDLGTIAVIDGKTLLVTISTIHVLPPPMSTHKLEFERPINNIVFGSTDKTLLVILDDFTVKICEVTTSGLVEQFSSQLANSCEAIPLTINHFVYDSARKSIYGVHTLPSGHCQIKMYEYSESLGKMEVNTYYDTTDQITNLTCVIDPSETKLQLAVREMNRVLIAYSDSDSHSLVPNLDRVLTEDNTDGGGHMFVKCINAQYYTFCLNEGQFYFNGQKTANNITSILLCIDHLLLTTVDKIMCMKLSTVGLDRLSKACMSQVYTRTIPDGALLVKAFTYSRKIVYQVPRGELETINLRSLAISEIDNLLAQKKHLEAYMIVRSDRINPNILYDINPTRFLNDLEDFIKNVNKCEYIDVFLMQLKNENLTEKLYASCFETFLPKQQVQNKIFNLADKFIEAMKSIDLKYYLQSIITAYVCKGTDEDLEKALELLSSANEQEKSNIKYATPVNNTLEHLIILSSVEKIYQIALGMDRQDIIMWVASKSQRDPLEYIPFLEDLLNMEYNYRNYKINCHIRRFERAFKHLIHCDNVMDELKEFITQNNLFSMIIKHVSSDNQWYKPLMQIYAKHLYALDHRKESGLIFMKIEDYHHAADSFALAGCVNETLRALQHNTEDTVAVSRILSDLAVALIRDNKYKEASDIYELHLNNYEEAISILIKGKLWADAIRIATKYRRKDVIESEIIPSLIGYYDDLCSSLNGLETEFINLKGRLQTVRTQKLEQLTLQQTPDHENQANENLTPEGISRDIDLESVVSTNYSVATSQRTRTSNMSSMSSRRQRRIDRKVLQIREGNVYENIAIIRRLHMIITEIQNFAGSVEDTCTQLFALADSYDRAVKLNCLYDKLLKDVFNAVDIIWPNALLIPPDTPTIEYEMYRHNMENLEIQFRFPPQNLNKWKKILILDS